MRNLIVGGSLGADSLTIRGVGAGEEQTPSLSVRLKVVLRILEPECSRGSVKNPQDLGSYVVDEVFTRQAPAREQGARQADIPFKPNRTHFKSSLKHVRVGILSIANAIPVKGLETATTIL